MVKALLSIAIYLSLVTMLGFVFARFVPREQLEHDFGDDES